MTSRDVADRIRHCDDHKTERKRGEKVRDVVLALVASEDRRGAARKENEDERSDEFGEEFPECAHKSLSFLAANPRRAGFFKLILSHIFPFFK